MRPELAPIAFIAAVSLLLPLPWHYRANNIATLSIIAWLFILNSIYAIDAIVWAGNVDVVATVWCDITTKLIVGANFALPTACLCICIHLQRLASMRPLDPSRRLIFEASMCWGLPLLFMALHYIVQGHRFDIIEDYGCRPTTYFSIPSILIVYLPTILISIGALIFAGTALRHFVLHRLTFAAQLNSSNSVMTTSRYIRLIAMSAIQMFWSLTTTCYTLWFTTISIPLRPWTSWDNVHSNFLRIAVFPARFTPPLVLRTYYVLWWLPVASTFLFVFFFSFGKDAVDEYKRCFASIKSRISLPTKKGFSFSSPTKPHLPISNPTLVGSSRASFTLRPSKDSFICLSSPTTSHTSELTRCPSGTTASYFFKGPKALGSIRDFSEPPTPSTVRPDPEKPLPGLPPSYPGPRLAAVRENVAPRPFTYPSNGGLNLDIDLNIV